MIIKRECNIAVNISWHGVAPGLKQDSGVFQLRCLKSSYTDYNTERHSSDAAGTISKRERHTRTVFLCLLKNDPLHDEMQKRFGSQEAPAVAKA